MKKLILFFCLLFITNFILAQEVVLNISAVFNGEKLPLDSIKIINNTSNDSIVFKNLADSVNYNINMQLGTWVKNDEYVLGDFEPVSVLNNSPGNLSFRVNKNETSELDVSVYNLSGKKLFYSHQKTTGMNTVFDVQIAENGLFLVQLVSKDFRQTFKCAGNESFTATKVSQSTNKTKGLKSAALSPNYRFAIGDQATVIIYKAYYKTQFLDFTVSASQSLEFRLQKKHEITGGTFFDLRDDHEYRYVNIGSQSWMAENLAYKDSSGCWAIEDYEPYVKTYGRLYNYASAERSCPAGWHLPTDDEWSILAEQISTDNGGYEIDITGVWQDVGKHLKAKGTKNNNNGLWKIDEYEFEGIDDYGFSALPAANRISLLGEFLMYGNLGYDANWWSSTTYSANYVWYRSLRYNNNDFARSIAEKSEHDALSVRCIKNTD